MVVGALFRFGGNETRNLLLLGLFTIEGTVTQAKLGVIKE